MEYRQGTSSVNGEPGTMLYNIQCAQQNVQSISPVVQNG